MTNVLPFHLNKLNLIRQLSMIVSNNLFWIFRLLKCILCCLSTHRNLLQHLTKWMLSFWVRSRNGARINCDSYVVDERQCRKSCHTSSHAVRGWNILTEDLLFTESQQITFSIGLLLFGFAFKNNLIFYKYWCYKEWKQEKQNSDFFSNAPFHSDLKTPNFKSK